MRRGPVVLAMDRVALSGVAEAIPATPSIATPTITSPADAAVDVSTSPTVTSSAFAVTNGGSDTHASSDWQAATDAGFSTIVEESLADTSNLESYDFSGLDPETPHWVRVRHNGTTYGASDWSPAVRFTTAAAPAYDADAQAYFDAMSVEPSTAVKEAVDALVTGLKSDGDWSSIDFLMELPMHTEQAFLLDLIDPTRSATAVNSPTYTPYVGGAGNGSSSYYNLGWDPATDGVNFTQNDAFYGIWLVSGTDSGSASKCPIGHQYANYFYPRYTDGKVYGGVNSSGVGQLPSVTPSTVIGFTTIERVSSTQVYGYRDGSTVGTFAPLNSAALANKDWLTGAINNNAGTAAVNFMDNVHCCAIAGAGLGSAGQARVYARLATFRTAMAAAAP